MAYENEESNKQIVFTVDNESSMGELNERIKELEEVYRKAKAWEYLKEEMRSMFVWGYDLPKGTPSKYMNEAYGIVFKTMCELDGTKQFSNLLSDLEDE